MCPLPSDSCIEKFSGATQPEFITTSARGPSASHDADLGYWDRVYQLAMGGDLTTVVALLQMHSEIAEALSSEQDRHNNNHHHRGPASSHSLLSKVQCEELLDVLSCHPFAHLTAVGSVPSSSCSSFSTSTSNGYASAATSAAVGGRGGGRTAADRSGAIHGAVDSLVQQWSAWQNRVRALRQNTHSAALLVRIPELDTVLRVLQGEKYTLEHLAAASAGSSSSREDDGGADWGWARLVVATLLYVHPPPLGRADLCRIVEACMRNDAVTSAQTSL
jgi:hypothetical protein